MKRFFLFSTLAIVACTKQQPQPPVGGITADKDLSVSQNRTKNLNLYERKQIEEWIKHQDEKFYPMGLNYWVNKPDLEKNTPKNDGDRVSYEYELYDFDKVKLYNDPIVKKGLILGKFEELKAVNNVVKYLKPGDEATLLVPSVLAFGTYGDNNKISYDMPLIIKLKVFEN